jgi:hypothetical protein
MQTRAISLDPIESRRVKDARLEHVLHEPLAFDATMAGLRPWPWGWASDHEGRDHHRSAAAQLHLVATLISMPGTLHAPNFILVMKRMRPSWPKGQCS